MKRFFAILATLALASSGCLFGEKEGYFQMKASDAPGDIDDFSAVLVQVTAVHVHRDGQPGGEDGEGNETGSGWVRHSVTFNKQTVDLLKVIDGDTWEFFNKTLEPGKYTQVRLEVESARGTLKNGTRISMEVPPSLKFVKPFEIEKGKTTTFVADMNVHRTGDMAYKIQPNLGNTKVMGPA